MSYFELTALKAIRFMTLPARFFLRQKMNDPRHPIWGVAKGLVAVLVLFVILWFSSTRFDNTELETVGWFAAIYAIIQGSHEFLKKGK